VLSHAAVEGTIMVTLYYPVNAQFHHHQMCNFSKSAAKTLKVLKLPDPDSVMIVVWDML